jgi:hypothetical protein
VKVEAATGAACKAVVGAEAGEQEGVSGLCGPSHGGASREGKQCGLG